MARHRGKRIGPGDIVGREGIHFIGLTVTRMGLLWRENSAPEAGIDGYIEVRDEVTGEVFNTYIFAQSKAGASYFKNESDDTFDFYCQENDIAYWTSGNVPVILIVSRNGNEGYWIDVKSYFADAKRRESKKITFVKGTQRFAVESRGDIIALGEPQDAGLYLDPIPKSERLFTNILPVDINYDTVFVGTTLVNSQTEFDRRIYERYEGRRLWSAYDGAVVSLLDLRAPPFVQIIDEGSVEEFTLDDFHEPDLQGQMIQLLNRCLIERLDQFEIRYHEYRNHELFYFEYQKKGHARLFQYQSLKETTRREVVSWKRSGRKGQDGYCRHSAAELRFRSYDRAWYLEIVPTYRFTSDGFHHHRNAKSLLKGIKALEHNKSVMGQTLMWADVLSLNQGMFEDGSSPLTFKKIVREDYPCGIIDRTWRPADKEEQLADAVQEGLFE